jgi:hypothetical protein
MSVYSPSGSGNVHVDEVLTNISIEWPINRDFIGQRLFPAIRVRKQSDKYGIFDREKWKLEKHDVRAPGTVANEIPGMTYSLDTYYANEHSLQIAVTDEERENADAPLTPDSDATDIITMRIMLGREKAMKDMATATANYATGHVVTLSGTTQWNDYANSNPISDVRTGVRTIHSKLFTQPNLMVIPWLVMSTLEDHPDFIERIKYSERAILSQDIIAAIFGIPNVVVPGAGYSTAGTGVPVTSANTTYLWGKDVILAYVPGTPGVRQIGFGYEFVWGIDGREQVVDRWREDPRKSDLIRCSRRYDLKLVGHEGDGKLLTGYLIKDAIL